MLFNFNVQSQEEFELDKEYYRPYEKLLDFIDDASGLETPPTQYYPKQIDSLDEVAIDVIGNIENQLDLLDGITDKITTDLWECIWFT